MAGRHKTPTSILDARGAFKKHPERKRDNEPPREGTIGYAPKWFSPGQRELWNEIKGLIHTKILGKSDRIAYEILVTLMYRYRHAPGTDDEPVAPLNGSEFSRLVTILGKFGMTPSDRAGLIVEKEKPKNPFDL